MFLLVSLVPAISSADVLPPPTPYPTPVCNYPTTLEGCNYIPGPNYNVTTGCGMVLSCPSLPDVEITRVTRTLKLGMKNDSDVRILQNYLNVILKTTLTIDGSFGPKTKSAVISFQKTNNLNSDGIVGVKTLSKMKERLQ